MRQGWKDSRDSVAMCQTPQQKVSGFRDQVSARFQVPGYPLRGAFGGKDGLSAGRHLHLVLAQLLGVEALEPLLQTVAIGPLRVEVDGLRTVDHVLLHQDW